MLSVSARFLCACNYGRSVNAAISGFVVRDETLSLSQLLFCVEAESGGYRYL